MMIVNTGGGAEVSKSKWEIGLLFPITSIKGLVCVSFGSVAMMWIDFVNGEHRWLRYTNGAIVDESTGRRLN